MALTGYEGCMTSIPAGTITAQMAIGSRQGLAAGVSGSLFECRRRMRVRPTLHPAKNAFVTRSTALFATSSVVWLLKLATGASKKELRTTMRLLSQFTGRASGQEITLTLAQSAISAAPV